MLCVCWPSGSDVDNVVSCVANVVLDVVIVVICGCCDGVVHGEPLVILVMLAGCNCGSCVVILVV